jgi:hypothetical protein
LYFLHVPKAAGTTVRVLMENAYAHHEIMPVYKFSELDRIGSGLEAFHLYRGHLGIGLLERLKKRPGVVVWMREPAELVLSLYSFQHQVARLPPDMGIEAWLAREEHPCVLSSFVVRGWLETPKAPWEEVEGRVLEVLEHSLVCGLVEEQELSVQLLCHRLGLLPPPLSPRLNVTRGRLRRGDLGERALALLEMRTEADRRVYGHARVVFARQVAEMDRELGGGKGALFSLEERRDLLVRHFWSKNRRPGVSALDYTFDQPLVGWGWQEREFLPPERERCFRWTGPENESVIWLPLCRRKDLQIELEVLMALDGSRGGRLRLWVEGKEVPLSPVFGGQILPEGHIWRGCIPAAPSAPEGAFTALCFQVPELICPRDRDPAAMDFRKLGVAMAGIRIRSARS